MQAYQQPFSDDFGHLEGASGYSVDLDDSSSLHSSVLPSDDQAPDANDQYAQARTDVIDQLNFENLAISGLDGHNGSTMHDPLADQEAQAAANVANLYEDDFDGMLDDLNREELPPHACRSVSFSHALSLAPPLTLCG